MMAALEQSTVENKLLRALAPSVFVQFAPHLRCVDLPVKYVLVEPEVVTTELYFLESGLGSAVTESKEGGKIEIGHIGREGMSAPHIVLMTEVTPNTTFMQVAGAGFVMPVRALQNLLDNDRELRRLFLNYVHTTELQLAHSALANGRYSVYQRLARWLLMVHDRIDGNDLPLTHEFLSLMLGVRRSGVTDQIHILEGEHAIKATRGNIRVLDRDRLKEVAGGCYGVPEREYARLIRQPLARDARRMVDTVPSGMQS
jgi:CRP-like cAMP-binding protein